MPPKPNFVDRHSSYMSILELNTVITKLEDAYEATHNEQVLSVLQFFKAKQAAMRNNENAWAEEDLQVLIDNLHLFPYSVTTWVTGYRDNEMSS
jgi:hypothetical protein